MERNSWLTFAAVMSFGSNASLVLTMLVLFMGPSQGGYLQWGATIALLAGSFAAFVGGLAKALSEATD